MQFPRQEVCFEREAFLILHLFFSLDSASVEHVVVQLLCDKPRELVFHGVKASTVK